MGYVDGWINFQWYIILDLISLKRTLGTQIRKQLDHLPYSLSNAGIFIRINSSSNSRNIRSFPWDDFEFWLSLITVFMSLEIYRQLSISITIGTYKVLTEINFIFDNYIQWYKMVQNDTTWYNMIQNDAKWYKMIQKTHTEVTYSRTRL